MQLSPKTKLFFLCFIVNDIILIIAILFYIYLAHWTHFPFVSIKYFNNPKQFNDLTALNYNLTISDKIQTKIKSEFAETKFSANSTKNFDMSIIKQLTRYTRSRLKPNANIDEDIEKIVFAEKEYNGICSAYSKLLITAAAALGIKARVVWLLGHTVSELYFADTGWTLVDANGNLIYRNKNTGKLASVTDLVDNINDYLPERIIEEYTNDPEYLNKPMVKVFDKNKIVIAIDNNDVYDFEIRSKKIENIIDYILGKDIALGIQYLTPNSSKFGNNRNFTRIFFITEFLLAILMIYLLVLAIKRKDK